MFEQKIKIVNSRDIDYSSLKDVVDVASKSLNPDDGQKFADIVTDLAKEKKLTFRNINNICSLSNLYKDMKERKITYKYFDKITGEKRDITTSAFPVVAGAMAVAEVNIGYDSVEKVSDQLCTIIADTNEVVRVSNIYGVDSGQTSVGEGQEYPLLGGGEDWVQIGSNKNGRRVEFPEEFFIRNDRTAYIAEQLAGLGAIVSKIEERHCIARITDVYGSRTSSASAPYVYNPKGIGTGLYTTGTSVKMPSGNRIQNNGLADTTDIDSAFAVLGKMKDKSGIPIGFSPAELVLVCPFALAGTAYKIVNSELVPGTINAMNVYGPRGQWPIKVVTTQWLDYHDVTTWYLGNFAKQFRKKVAKEIEVVTLGGITEGYIKNGIALSARASFDCEVGAIDTVYVVQNLSGTTYTPTVPLV